MARRKGLLKFSGCLPAVISLLLLTSQIGAVSAAENSGELRGIVRGANGTPLPGVVVGIRGAKSNLEKTEKSDADGAFAFRALPPGAYVLTYTAAGYRTLEQEIVVEVAWETSVVAELTTEQPGEGPPSTVPAPRAEASRTSTRNDS